MISVGDSNPFKPVRQVGTLFTKDEMSDLNPFECGGTGRDGGRGGHVRRSKTVPSSSSLVATILRLAA